MPLRMDLIKVCMHADTQELCAWIIKKCKAQKRMKTAELVTKHSVNFLCMSITISSSSLKPVFTGFWNRGLISLAFMNWHIA
jgi:hypothetical protein